MERREQLAICQLAYYVPDLEAAAKAHSASFGSGPFFVFRHVPLTKSVHRGVERAFDHSSAYGQWGDVMVEFVEVHSATPSAFSDVFPIGSDRYGLHHSAIMVDDLAQAIGGFALQGMALAQLSETTTGTQFAFVDATNTIGHMIELYEASDALTGFYGMVREASQNWDGSDLIRDLGALT
ncbi:MAG: VOC family protein [Pseudomonadota bacterium]